MQVSDDSSLVDEASELLSEYYRNGNPESLEKLRQKVIDRSRELTSPDKKREIGNIISDMLLTYARDRISKKQKEQFLKIYEMIVFVYKTLNCSEDFLATAAIYEEKLLLQESVHDFIRHPSPRYPKK